VFECTTNLSAQLFKLIGKFLNENFDEIANILLLGFFPMRRFAGALIVRRIAPLHHPRNVIPSTNPVVG
jgi:hypothetical protein